MRQSIKSIRGKLKDDKRFTANKTSCAIIHSKLATLEDRFRGHSYPKESAEGVRENT